jgi:hypothetical protein
MLGEWEIVSGDTFIEGGGGVWEVCFRILSIWFPSIGRGPRFLGSFPSCGARARRKNPRPPPSSPSEEEKQEQKRNHSKIRKTDLAG